jgi:SAM-dependent methyltransferase
VPRSYYHRSSPIGQWFTAREGAAARSIALVGLGTGTMAAYGRPGDRLDFYEIDPEVVELARDPRYFTYLTDARAPTEVVLGDARLRLAASERSYDVIVLDAFGSDAIPTHLMTREAVELYLQRLRPGGVIAFHISSRTFDLAPPLARIAEHLGLAGAHQNHSPGPALAADGAYATEYVLLARDPADLSGELAAGLWTPLEGHRQGPEWTDDFVDLLSAFRWQLTR